MSDPAADDLSEQERVRRGKREQLETSGQGAYPVIVPRTTTLAQLRATYDSRGLEEGAETGDAVSVTGRVIFLRNTGKLCFARLREGDGTELQAMISLAGVGADSLDSFKSLVDIGDHLSVSGQVVMSRRGELSVQARSWQMAAKALRPLPNEHRPLSDEARVRLRYLDMVVRPEAREMVRAIKGAARIGGQAVWGRIGHGRALSGGGPGQQEAVRTTASPWR